MQRKGPCRKHELWRWWYPQLRLAEEGPRLQQLAVCRLEEGPRLQQLAACLEPQLRPAEGQVQQAEAPQLRSTAGPQLGAELSIPINIRGPRNENDAAPNRKFDCSRHCCLHRSSHRDCGHHGCPQSRQELLMPA